MTLLFHEAQLVQASLDRLRWPFCFIGGLAVARWGEVRVTNDIDVTLFVGFGNEPHFVDALFAEFPSRFPDSRDFALQNRVALLRTHGGVDLDIGLGGLPYEEEMIARASLAPMAPGVSLKTCSAEDLIVLKAFAERDRDWADVRGIAARQLGHLDWPAIYERLRPLAELKEAPECLLRLQRIQAETG